MTLRLLEPEVGTFGFNVDGMDKSVAAGDYVGGLGMPDREW